MVQLLISRALHDLSGPAGALSNGVELAVEAGTLDAAVSDLLSFSAAILLGRLRLLSFAFGRSDDSAVRPLFDAGEVVQRFVSERPQLTVTFPQGEAPGWLSSLLPALVLVAVDCLPNQGKVEVLALAENQGWRVIASGPVLRLEPDLIGLLNGSPGQSTARTVPALFARRIAAAHGWRLEACREDEAGEGRLVMTVGKR